MDGNTKYYYCYYLYSFYKQIIYLFDQRVQNTSGNWSTWVDTLAKTGSTAVLNLKHLYIYFCMSYTAHSHFWFSTILDCIQHISWNILFFLSGMEIILSSLGNQAYFSSWYTVLSGQPAALNFAKELCSQTSHFLCASDNSFSTPPLLLLFYICSRDRRLQRHSACTSQYFVVFLASQMTFLPICWVILIISQTVFIL